MLYIRIDTNMDAQDALFGLEFSSRILRRKLRQLLRNAYDDQVL